MFNQQTNLFLCFALKRGVQKKFEKSDGCPPSILLTEKEHFGDNVWMYDAQMHQFHENLNWKFRVTEGSETDSGSKWNRKGKQWYSLCYIFYSPFSCLVLYLYLLLLHFGQKKEYNGLSLR